MLRRPSRAWFTPRRAGRAALLAAAFAALGLILGSAATQVRRERPSTARAKSALTREISQRQRAVDSARTAIARLRSETGTLRADTASESKAARAATARLQTLELVAGASAVHGQGVDVRLADAPAASPGGDAKAGRILYTDLQQVTNALWAAGADAIAIDGVRVTSLTSIRSAGSGIVVDFRPVTPPYDVVAIGNPDTLEPAFVASPAAAQLRTYSQVYGIGFQVQSQGQVTLPATSTLGIAIASPGPPAR